METFRVQLHTHGSGSEGRASIRAQEYMARATDAVDAIWWTEHDFRLANYAKLDTLACNAVEETIRRPARVADADHPPATIETRWEPITDCASCVPDDGILDVERADSPHAHLTFSHPGGQTVDDVVRWNLVADNYRQRFPMFSEPQLEASVRTSPGAAAFIEVVLSQQPPDLAQPRIQYLLGHDRAPATPDVPVATKQVTVDQDGWTEVVLDLPADVTSLGLPAGGLDNALYAVRVGLSTDTKPQSIGLDGLTFAPRYVGPGMLERQRELVSQLPLELPSFVGMEVSWYGQHINAFGSSVPLPAYWDRSPDELDTSGVVTHIHDHGGIASYNHPDTTKLDDHAERLIRHDAYNVEVLEVGRRDEDPTARLALWDRLSAAGIAVTGVGVGDVHHATDWERDQPSASWWVTHLYADTCTERALIDALTSGRGYFARPAAFEGTVDIQGDGVSVMGAIDPTASRNAVTATVSGAEPGDVLRWICNGEVLTSTVLEQARSTDSITIPAGDGVRAIRWELLRSYPPTGDPTRIACSNPFYIASSREAFSSATLVRRPLVPDSN